MHLNIILCFWTHLDSSLFWTHIRDTHKHLTVEIHSVICDAPAQTFVKNVKQYSGYHGCDQCTQEGEWKGTMTFPERHASIRTDNSFIMMTDEDHHQGLSPFTYIGL
jgi:hypothetical protein